MKTVIIKRTRKDLPLMLLITAVFLFPGLYTITQSSTKGIAFSFGVFFTFLVVVMAVFGFNVVFKRHGFLTFNEEGVGFKDFFYRWEDIRSYRMVTGTEKHYSQEMNSYQEREIHAIILTLKDENSVCISLDKLSKGPDEIVEIFGIYRNRITQFPARG